MTPKLDVLYAEPHRRYHTRSHIEACLALLERLDGVSGHDRKLLTWAIWWHDAIYDPTGSGSEARSADLARSDLAELGVGEADREEVVRLILLTAGHQVETGDRLGEILVSIDLAILGASPEQYDKYARDVRQEYAHVPDALWRPGRTAVLRHFLDAPAIYPHPEFRSRLEAQARANIAREIAALEPR